MKSIKTDIFSFEKLRKGDYLYVDKTAFVWELVKEDGIYFLSRPRRFGKSLLLSTFDAFFRGRKDLFAGLEIEKLAPEKWEEYPIVNFSMTQCGGETVGVEEIKRTLCLMVQEQARKYDIQLVDGNYADKFKDLILNLKEKFVKPVVILIDEYDKPILDHLVQDDVHDVVATIKRFYQVIKDCNADERFVFITGVTKFAHTSLFSGFNNPTDLTWNRKFATMLGYTDEELRANFADYIAETAKEIEMDADEMLAIMKRKYDGFCFAPKSPTVYNPVSVGKFFYNGGEFDNYWSDTGTPAFFLKAAEQTPMSVVEKRRGTYVDKLSIDKYEVDKLDPFVFAVQTGYLTLKDVRWIGEESDPEYKFDYPNSEVRHTFARFLLGAYLNCRETEVACLVKEMRTVLEAGEIDEFLTRVKYVLKGLAFGNLGEDKSDPIRFYEGYFRNLLTFLMTLLNIDNEPETRTADGQVDLVARAGGHRYVFELKCGCVGENLPQIPQNSQMMGDGVEGLSGEEAVGEDQRDLRDLREKNVQGLLDSAIAQAHAKGYYEKYLAYPQDIQLIALAFGIETRTLAGWRVERVR